MDRRFKKKMDLYWDREVKKAKKCIDSLDFSTWFDFWHTHPDWNSKGNKLPELRRAVAQMTYDLLGYAEVIGSVRGRW